MKTNKYEIPIEGKKIVGEPKKIEINLIQFDDQNPRISMAIDSEKMGSGAKEFSQQMLAFYLKSQSSYNELKKAISHSGGATIPIWVYPIEKGFYKVIEGNTRLLIHKELSLEEDDKYQVINCIVLPYKLEDEIKDYIRLICHLRGHTDWDKYEQAKYLFNLHQKDKYPIKELAKITKLSKTDILQDIEAYKIMDGQFKDMFGESELVHKFSYFKEYTKNTKLKSTMSQLKLSDKDFCKWIGNKKMDRAMDVRKLNDVLKESESREVFLKKDLDRALEKLKDLVPEKSEKIYILMNDLNKKIGQIPLEETMEIRSLKSKRRKIVLDLIKRLNDLLGEN